MSDKLQKSTTAIEVVKSIGDAIERAVEGENKPANTRQISAAEVCKCGHTFGQHNYSDSLPSDRNDPLGFLYECNGAGFTRFTREKGSEARCKCERFESDGYEEISTTTASPVVWNRCIADVDRTGPHTGCPGSVGVTDIVYCKCSCEVCLTATRKALRTNRGLRAIRIDKNVITDESTCITCGDSSQSHFECGVVRAVGGITTVCMCECRECKRAWFGDGRPVVRGGKVLRTTPESFNPIKTTAEDVERWQQMKARVDEERQRAREALARAQKVGEALRNSTKPMRERVLGDNRPEDIIANVDYEDVETRTVAASIPPVPSAYDPKEWTDPLDATGRRRGEKFMEFARKVGSPDASVLATPGECSAIASAGGGAFKCQLPRGHAGKHKYESITDDDSLKVEWA